MKLINLCCVLALISPALSANVDALGIRSDFKSAEPVNQGVPYFNGRAYPDLQNEGLTSYERDERRDTVRERRAGTDRSYSMEILEESFFFPHNSATLTTAQKRKLNELARSLRNDSTAQGVRVMGFASAVGNPNYNKELSQRRADAVSDYLEARGVKLMLESKGLGELTTLRASDARRVDMTVETDLYSE